jgi:hypothetical protein
METCNKKQPPNFDGLDHVGHPGGAHASCKSNDEPHGQRRNDEEQQCAHSRGRSPVIRGTSGLPVAPPDFRFHDGNDRMLIRHRSAS